MAHPPGTGTGTGRITETVRDAAAASAALIHVANPDEAAEVVAYLTPDAAASV